MRQFVRIEEGTDFKIRRLPHSIVKQAHSASVRELIFIENHPHRQRDLQQSQSLKSFSPESKQMVHEVGNIELCELLDTEPKTQCKVFLSYWNIGIVYCTCGHLLHRRIEETQKFIKYTMNLLSVPDYYIQKGRLHGHRYGKKRGETRNTTSPTSSRKCKKKNFQGIHDRFVRDDKFRSRMIQIDRTEDLCREMDDLADEDHTHHLTPQEYCNRLVIGEQDRFRTTPFRRRSDFKQALSTLTQLKEKEEEEGQRNQRWAHCSPSSSSWWSWTKY